MSPTALILAAAVCSGMGGFPPGASAEPFSAAAVLGALFAPWASAENAVADQGAPGAKTASAAKPGAVVVSADGAPKVRRGGHGEAVRLKVSDYVYEGDVIVTGKGDHVSIGLLTEGTPEMKIDENSEFKLEPLGRGGQPSWLKGVFDRAWRRFKGAGASSVSSQYRTEATAVAAVRGFALRYGRAKGEALEALTRLSPPFYTPEEYQAFHGEGPRARPAAWDTLTDQERGLLVPYESGIEETGIGMGIAARVAARGLVEDRALLGYLNMVGALLSEAAGDPGDPFTIYVMKGEDVNAVSVPGGFIFISEALLRTCKDEAELAAVIGHEMTHIIKRHGLQEIHARRVELNAESAMEELDKEAGPAAQNPAMANLDDFADQAYEYVHKPRLQKFENEADRGALLMLAKAGYDPQAGVDILTRVGAAIKKAKTADPSNPFTTMDFKKRAEAAAVFARKLPGGGVRNEERFTRNAAPK